MTGRCRVVSGFCMPSAAFLTGRIELDDFLAALQVTQADGNRKRIEGIREFLGYIKETADCIAPNGNVGNGSYPSARMRNSAAEYDVEREERRVSYRQKYAVINNFILIKVLL